VIRAFTGAVIAATAALAGLWLMLAPFALGTQPPGPWNPATVTEFCTGAVVTLVGVLGAVAFAAAIRADLVARGLVAVRAREPEPTAPPPSSAELAALLTPLVEALREDLDALQNGWLKPEHGTRVNSSSATGPEALRNGSLTSPEDAR
jgi:hypothetical protein